MSKEQRFVLFIILMFVWMLAFPHVMRFLGLNPPPKKPAVPPVAAADQDQKAADAEKKTEAGAAANEPAKAGAARDQAAAGESGQKPTPEAPKKPEVALVEESELVLGSVVDKSPTGYRIEARLTQKGAGVEALSSGRFDAEFRNGVVVKEPLQLIKPDRSWPASLALTLSASKDGEGLTPPPADDELAMAAAESEDLLDATTWEVVRDEQGRIRRPARVTDPATGAEVEGEAIVFKTRASNGVVITKTYRLGKNIDGLEVELKFESPDQTRKAIYNLWGPHGIPIEGEWYTSTFLDLYFGLVNPSSDKPETYAANDVAKATPDKPIESTTLPLRYAGIENQYFTTLIEPVPAPTGQADRWDSRTIAVAHRKEDALQKSDVAFRITSQPIVVGPGQPVVHTYRVFAGPKVADALRPYGAERLATYRKNQWIPLAPEVGRYVITPTLDITYRLTAWVAHLFGWKNGNFGIAIILLTVIVRGLMFPLGRKQAIAAQKMQALQPLLKELQEKFKDDKEKLTKETFALYKRYGVNPMGGCLPALIQLPIFVGLWQALNTSVALRHERFLWIRDLAAPDMMFRFPAEIPFLGEWFNLLPFLVVGLMLIQTKLFSPPATNPEAEASQKMMKFMMIFMGVMFYKVPSGLGLYFITSSLWAIGERLLLPKVTHTTLIAAQSADEDEAGDEKWSSGNRSGANGDGQGVRAGKVGSGTNVSPAKPQGKLAQLWERVLEEARKDSTYRKLDDEREGKGRQKDKGGPRPRPRRR